ncbi:MULTISPECIES: alpha/beta hydrolase [unclassified Butyrivibrio]|uniref:alpha/beta hydrolase n=1 Tax=unclassified Butyrivibrio TaxID=2639466 RepID=UPI000411E420|nr:MULTISPECIES: alpha/beta fold hydrolase [unclassified Butyrivibrio]
MKKGILKKVLIIAVSAVAVLVVGGSVAMGGYVTDQILYQNRNNDTVANSVLQLEMWNYDLEGFQSRYTGQDISVTAEDGNEIPGTYYDNGSDKCVILVHGAGGDRVFNAPWAEAYLERGFDVITYDQRGHGKNPDKKVTFGIHEQRDVKALVTYARTELGKSKVIVHGQSMGGQTTALYASNVTPGEVDAADAVICDSPVPGMESFLRLMFGDGPKGAYSPMSNYLIATSKIYMKLFKGIDYADGDTVKAVKNDKLPTMILISDRDEVCLPDMVEEVYENVGTEDKEMAIIDSSHIRGIVDDKEEYMAFVDSFLKEYGLF